MDKCIDVRGQEYLAGIFKKIAQTMVCENPEQAIAIFRKMMNDMELKNPEAGDREEELKVLSTSVNPVRLQNNPIRIGETEAYMLYNSIVR